MYSLGKGKYSDPQDRTEIGKKIIIIIIITEVSQAFSGQ